MKIGIGAVQFGTNYGISNKSGKTPESEVRVILTAAYEFGVRFIDTAALYGNSEEVIGRAMPPDTNFNIVTKTVAFSKQVLDEIDAQHLEDAFRTSLIKLRMPSVYGLLMHRADDLLLPGGELLMNRLSWLKKEGVVSKIGVSVYSSQQIDQVLDRFSIDLIQLPINVLDQRLLRSGHLEKLKRSGIEIHARSVFLQGLLLMEQQDIPDYFNGVREKLDSYHQIIRERGLTPLQASLGFVSGIPEIDQVICGVNNSEQLREICKATQAKVDWKEFTNFAVFDESIVNPSLWRLDEEKKGSVEG
jgi:aryl-alcohol dehydrogenase-like predicted oxidoreductase